MSISLILVATAKELSLFDKSFGEKYNFKVEVKTSDHSEALKAADAFLNPVVAIYVNDTVAVKNFVEELNEKKVKHISICRNAQDGFTMLALGASGMITRSKECFIDSPGEIESLLSIRVKSAHDKYFKDDARSLKGEYGKFDHVIAIGSSTGGTETILRILQEFPSDAPPILIVQHMPPVFTRLYAERIHNLCNISVWEAQDGDELKRGLALLAPGDFQMSLEKKGGVYRVRCEKGAPVSGHCPSVDVLFGSVAEVFGNAAIGVILTGMGKDGAQGLLKMRSAGGMTFGQDKETSIVYGMPKEADNLGAVVKQLPESEIAGAIIKII